MEHIFGPNSPSLFGAERLAFAAAVAAANGSFSGLAEYLWPLGHSPVTQTPAAAIPGSQHHMSSVGYPLFWPKKPLFGSAMHFGEFRVWFRGLQCIHTFQQNIATIPNSSPT